MHCKCPSLRRLSSSATCTTGSQSVWCSGQCGLHHGAMTEKHPQPAQGSFIFSHSSMQSKILWTTKHMLPSPLKIAVAMNVVSPWGVSAIGPVINCRQVDLLTVALSAGRPRILRAWPVKSRDRLDASSGRVAAMTSVLCTSLRHFRADNTCQPQRAHNIQHHVKVGRQLAHRCICSAGTLLEPTSLRIPKKVSVDDAQRGWYARAKSLAADGESSTPVTGLASACLNVGVPCRQS